MNDMPPPDMDMFYDKLQTAVIDQARKLINNHLYIQALISALPVPLIATDASGLIQNINRAAESILSIKSSAVKDQRLSVLFAHESGLEDRLCTTLSDGTPFHLGSEKIRLASGRKVIGNLYIQPVRDEEQLICGALITIEDQTYVNLLHDAFKRYVPPQISEIIARNPEQVSFGGEERELTVFFSDLAGFTSLSEIYPPKTMVTLLREYFDEMTRLIFREDGTLDAYTGDEIFAFFGAPVHQPDHAIRACRLALAMQKRLKEMAVEWPAAGKPALYARIGINTGRMLVGNLGSSYRFAYGVTGDNVNLGSRIEGLGKMYGNNLMISESTANAVKHAFVLREIDRVQVKGRETPLSVFEVIAENGTNIPDERKRNLEDYAAGLAAYRNREWKKAIDLFAQVRERTPDDGPSRVMSERCVHFQKTPPPDGWSGIYQHTAK